MAAKRRFTDDQLREAISWGLGNKATANRLACSESIIFRARRSLGIPNPRTPTQRKVRPTECLFLLVAGWDVTRLRKRYSCDRQVIYKLAWLGGIKVTKSPVRYPDWSDVDRLLMLGVRVNRIALATGHTTESICQRRRSIGAPKRKRKALLRRPGAPIGFGCDDSAGIAGAGCLLPAAGRSAMEAA